MVIRASVIFLSTVYADAVKVKPFRIRFFAPACVAMRNAFEKLYLFTYRVMLNAESVRGNGSGLGCGDSYINIKALDSVSAFILTQP